MDSPGTPQRPRRWCRFSSYQASYSVAPPPVSCTVPVCLMEPANGTAVDPDPGRRYPAVLRGLYGRHRPVGVNAAVLFPVQIWPDQLLECARTTSGDVGLERVTKCPGLMCNCAWWRSTHCLTPDPRPCVLLCRDGRR